MKIVNIENGKAGIFIPPVEILPLDGIYPPDTCRAIAERYEFVSSPDFSQSLAQIIDKAGGLEFEIGKFQDNDGEHFIGSFNIGRDGFIAGTNSTEIARIFLEDFFAWGAELLGFRIPSDLSTKFVYLSQIVVEFEEPLDPLIRGFEVLSGIFEKAFRTTYKVDMPMQFASIALDYDRSTISGALNQLSGFIISRRIEQPFSSNRFFCSAPLRTDDHIRLLEKIELLLSGDLGWADAD